MALAIRAVVAALAGTARAALPPGLSRAEAACERAFGPATDLFGAGIARCLVRCDAVLIFCASPGGAFVDGE